MKLELPNFEGDDTRGVSPVIGVILMVAITVILAAVIGAFVLDLGSNLGSTGPQTQLTAQQGSSPGDIVVNHKGGDALQVSEVKVQLNGTAVDSGNLTWGSDSSSEFTVGEKLTINADNVTDVTTGDTVELTIVHEPSQSILLSKEVKVPE